MTHTINGFKTRECAVCEGRGVVVDSRDVGVKMRKRREKAGLSLRELARRVKVSVAYMSDLELGRRNWHAGIIKRVEAQL